MDSLVFAYGVLHLDQLLLPVIHSVLQLLKQLFLTLQLALVCLQGQSYAPHLVAEQPSPLNPICMSLCRCWSAGEYLQVRCCCRLGPLQCPETALQPLYLCQSHTGPQLLPSSGASPRQSRRTCLLGGQTGSAFLQAPGALLCLILQVPELQIMACKAEGWQCI